MNIEDRLQQGKADVVSGIKKHIFDWIAAVIIVALIAASLDVFGLIDFDTTNFGEFLISWFPYFAAAILLHTDLYKKGVFVGKSTKKFTDAISSYSTIANSLSGIQIKGLYPFCEAYNRETRETIQRSTLREEGITFEEFDIGNVGDDADDKKSIPLKTLSKRQLLEKGYNERQIAAIEKARKVKVKGINVNILLSSNGAKDVTDIGDDERTLHMKQILLSAAKYACSTLLLSVLAMKDIGDWGWMGLVLVLFKVTYLCAGCCISYFKGYDDVTIKLVNHFTRKEDILKMYIDYKPDVAE